MTSSSIKTSGDLGSEQPEPQNESGISLSEYLSEIRQAIVQHGPGRQWIRVEISSLQKRYKGFWLLEFSETSEQGEQTAKVKGICRMGNCARIDHKFQKAAGGELQQGMKVLIQAECSLHTIYGIQLELLDVDPNYTLGDMEAKLKRIRSQLAQEGIYRNNKQLAPPRDFTNILLITPEQAAGLGDFMQNMGLLQESNLIKVTAETAVFEGSDAGRQISSIISKYSKYRNQFDAIFIIRGGGPKTSLAWLNDYQIAQAICDCGIPVIAGVGHERDYTIIDEVAHLALGTPSKAAGHIEQTIFRQAENALSNWEYIRQYLSGIIQNSGKECDHAMNYIAHTAKYLVQASENSCDQFRQSVRDNAGYIHKRESDQCDNIMQFLSDNSKSRIQYAKNSAEELLYSQIVKDSKAFVVQMKRDTRSMISEITSSGPRATLRRGFALTRNKNGRVVSSLEGAAREQELEIEYWDGKVNAIVGCYCKK